MMSEIEMEYLLAGKKYEPNREPKGTKVKVKRDKFKLSSSEKKSCEEFNLFGKAKQEERVNRKKEAKLRNLLESRLESIIKRSVDKREVNVSVDYLRAIIPHDMMCPILNIKMTLEAWQRNTISFDRIDNDLGYIRGNLQVVSMKANTMKSDASIEDLKQFAKWIGTLEEKLNEDTKLELR